MELNVYEFKKLFKNKFKSNFNLAARELGISPAHVYRVIKQQSKAGMEFLNHLMLYCNKNDIDYKQYINFFTSAVTYNQ